MVNHHTNLTSRGKALRRETITLAQSHGGYHFGGSFSVCEILLAYFDIATPDDVLVFSKGHGCWPLYVLLRERGLNPLLEGHPYRDPANGIEYTTGSLGHGLPAAVGMALALQMQQKPGRVFAILGEGDLQEGTFWESLLIAAHRDCSNLVAVVDHNGIQGSGRTPEILPITAPAASAARAAGWRVQFIPGHDLSILEAYMNTNSAIPTLIFAHTIKGRGVSFMEDQPEWHAKGMTPAETAQALAELQ